MNIALVTDTHLSTKDTALTENWTAVSRWINELKPDLAVHLGDITANGVHDTAELAHARALIARTGQDMLFLPGNHDIGDSPDDEGGASEEPLTPERLSDYRRMFGLDWWSFHAEGWQILGLNAQLLGLAGDEDAAQMAWLEETLYAGHGPLGLMIHKPICPPASSSRPAPGRYPPAAARRRLSSLLQGRDLRFVVSGHTHQALSFRQNGTEHVWVPSAAFCIPDAVQERVGKKCVGTAILVIEDDHHRFIDAAPPGLTRHNLLDLDRIYPQVLPIRMRLGPHAAL